MFPKLILFFSVLLFCVSCAGPILQPSPASAGSNADMLDKGAKELGEKMLAAFKADNADGFTSLLGADVRRQFGVKEFMASHKALSESLGSVESYSYLAKLDSPLFKTHIWKVVFVRADSKGNTVRQETLFRIVTGVIDGKSEAVSFGFL